MWIEYNPNPKKNNTNDCVIRALSKALECSWRKAKILVDVYSMELSQTEDSDLVWANILSDNGFTIEAIFCKNCNLMDFCRKHKNGLYVVKLPNHVVTVENGNYYDSWDSGEEIPIYYWRK